MTLTLDALKTGYFADPEKPEAPFPFVHAIKVVQPYEPNDAGLPLCDEPVPTGHVYQWSASEVNFSFVDCQKCRNILDNMATAEGRGPLVLFRHPSHV